MQELLNVAEHPPEALGKKIVEVLKLSGDVYGKSEELIYASLLQGEFGIAFQVAVICVQSKVESHAVGLSLAIGAVLSNDPTRLTLGVKIAKQFYSRIFPKERARIMKSVLIPTLNKLVNFSQINNEQFKWLMNIIYPDLYTNNYIAPSFSTLIKTNNIQPTIVDIGASDLGWEPNYKCLIDDGANLIGFEPDKNAYDQLISQKNSNLKYINIAVGSGKEETLHFFRDPGMTSCLGPKKENLDMFFKYQCDVLKTEEIQTVRLDDVEDVKDIDLLKMDIQGFELEVLKNARSKLKNTSIIDVEVSFIELYQNQPLFSEVEQFLREQGFQFFRFNYASDPTLNGTALQTVGPSWMTTSTGLISFNKGQVLWSDAIFIRNLNELNMLTDKQLLKMSKVLHDAYQSFEMVQIILAEYDRRNNTTFETDYLIGAGMN